MSNDYKRKEAIRLFPFFPRDKRSELYNYLLFDSPVYKSFQLNEELRGMPRNIFMSDERDLTQIIHGFIINGLKLLELPQIFNSIYDRMIQLEPGIEKMVVTETTGERIQNKAVEVVRVPGVKNPYEPVAVQIFSGGKRKKNKRKKTKTKKQTKTKKTKKSWFRRKM